MRRLLLAVLLLVSCTGDEPGGVTVSPVPSDLDAFDLSSPEFQEGGTIPEGFTCDGEGSSPPLVWSGVPEGSAELILTLLDPDTSEGVFTHWTVYAISPETPGFPAGSLPEGALEGVNDFGESGYGGPCPSGDEPHRYIFTLASLGEPSGLEPGADPSAVDAILQGAVATTTLASKYPG